MKNKFKVLSIDAWGNQEDGYEWNQWFDVGTIEIDINAGEPIILQTMVDAGYITQLEGATIDDDQYNLVICDKKTNEPLFAIEYGNTI
jgi:hypothetical protein